MRLAIDASNLRQGGGQTHLAKLLSAASPHEHNIRSVVVWGDSTTLDLLPQHTWLDKRLVSHRVNALPVRYQWQACVLRRALERTHCDLLFAPGGNVPSRFRPCVTMCQNMLPFSPSEGRRYGLTYQGFRVLLLRHLQARAFRRSDGVIFLNRYAKDAVLRYIGSCQGQVAVIPHGAAPEPDSPRPAKSPTNPHPGALKVVYVSIVDVYKHQWHVVDAVARARSATSVPLQLDLVGPAYPPALRRLRRALARFDGDGKWARYVGPVPANDIAQHYARADIGVFASSCENMPIILLEMMSAGLPIVCSDRGPMPDVLRDAGIYCDPESPDSIARALCRLVADSQLRAAMSVRAQVGAQRYTWDQCARDTFGFLRQVRDGFSNTKS
jgi:glycosyltransferase involved in cell wall biosynthesis